MKFERIFHHLMKIASTIFLLSLPVARSGNPDGTIVFSISDIEVPEQFSQVATDILAQKYFRKAGVPATR